MSVTIASKTEGHPAMAKALREAVEDILARTQDEPNGFVLISVPKNYGNDDDGPDFEVISNLSPSLQLGMLEMYVEDLQDMASKGDPLEELLTLMFGSAAPGAPRGAGRTTLDAELERASRPRRVVDENNAVEAEQDRIARKVAAETSALRAEPENPTDEARRQFDREDPLDTTSTVNVALGNFLALALLGGLSKRRR